MTRRLRLASGLVLFSYVVTHLVNHSLGIVSLAAMEGMLGWVRPYGPHPGHNYDLWRVRDPRCAGVLRAVAAPRSNCNRWRHSSISSASAFRCSQQCTSPARALMTACWVAMAAIT